MATFFARLVGISLSWQLFGIHQISGPCQLLLLARATHVAGEHASGTEWNETMAVPASYVQHV